jgi:hypothetical protein
VRTNLAQVGYLAWCHDSAALSRLETNGEEGYDDGSVPGPPYVLLRPYRAAFSWLKRWARALSLVPSW